MVICLQRGKKIASHLSPYLAFSLTHLIIEAQVYTDTSTQ